MTVNELINVLCDVEDQNAEILRLEFNENSSELTLVVAKDENWEEEYKIKVKWDVVKRDIFNKYCKTI